MKIANVSGRLALIRDEGGVDVAAASGGRFSPDPQAVYSHWKAFREWADDAPARGAAPIDVKDLGAPAPRSAQVFAIGANYRDHAAEAGLEVPASPATFTKFPTCLTAPFADVVLPSETVDWEVELVCRHGPARLPGEPGRRVGPRGRCHGRPGSVRPAGADDIRRALLPQQVLSWLWPHGTVARDTRRTREPGRP